MNPKNSNVRIITIRDLWSIFVHRLLIIILAAAASVAGLYAFNKIMYVPQYSSTATIYILRQGNESNTTDTNNDFSLALSVVNDCTYLLKSHTVLDQVIQDLSLNLTYEDLYKRITTHNPEETRVLEVTVTADSPDEAKTIVDEVCTIGSESIENAMGFQQVNLYEYGTQNSQPSNRMQMKTYAIVGLIAGVAVYLIFVIAYLLDDHLRSDEEIEKTLGVTILADIPNANHSGKGKYGYYGKYYSAYRQSEKGHGRRKRGEGT